MTPLISVVIPTANRPHYLPRAISSALSGIDVGDVEVIVVPNGPDNSWQETLLPYRENPSLRVVPVGEANANTARNTGLAEARGEYIRFLDDDDYLFAEQAVRQYELIGESGADVVSGDVRLVDEAGRDIRVWRQPDTDDLCEAVLGPLRNCLPTAHVYRRSSLGSSVWNPSTSVRQDVEWLLDLCASKELRWHKTGEVVGIWQQHATQRVSSGIHTNDICRSTVPMLLTACEALEKDGRFSDSRRQAAALGLWGLIVRAFHFSPLYWSRIARRAGKICPGTGPMHAKYNLPVVRLINPLLVQWILMPRRWILYRLGRL